MDPKIVISICIVGVIALGLILGILAASAKPDREYLALKGAVPPTVGRPGLRKVNTKGISIQNHTHPRMR